MIGDERSSGAVETPVQLTLSLPFEEALSVEDFVVSDANRHAFEFIHAWPEWPANVVLLSGPPGSGKTHLAQIWAEMVGAPVHRAKNLTFEETKSWLSNGLLVLEDADVFGLDQAALFHLVNTVRGGNGFLLITAEDKPAQWGLSLPDLESRLRAAVPIEIGAPDDVLMRQVFVKQFSDRQISIDPSVIDYLVSRIERSLKAVRDTVSLLDRTAFSKRRSITKRLASDILEF